MSVCTSSQLKSMGGTVSRKARFKKKLGGAESTYSIILRCLDEFHDETKNLNDKIDLTSRIYGLSSDWIINHTGTSRSETKRRNALNTLIKQLETIDWPALVMKNISNLITKEDFSQVDERGVVLRGNGPLEKKITEYSQLTGSFYARTILTPVVIEANKNPAITKDNITSSNKVKIKKVYDLLVNRIIASDIPSYFAKGARQITNQVLGKTGNNPAAGYNTLVNFVFLRLLNPYLTMPVVNGVVEKLPSGGNTTTTLVIIGALLQNQANRKSSFMDPRMDALSDLLGPYSKTIPKYLVKGVYRKAGGGTSMVMNKFYK